MAAEKLSTAVQRQITALKTQVAGITAALVKAKDLAPKFMQVFKAWQKETGGSFVSFCRTVDSTIPNDSQGKGGYLRNPAYNAMNYMRRLVEKPKVKATKLTPAARKQRSTLNAIRILKANGFDVVINGTSIRVANIPATVTGFVRKQAEQAEKQAA